MGSHRVLSFFFLSFLAVSSLSLADQDTLLLAGDAMEKAEYSTAIGIYDDILSVSPDNETAIAGRLSALSRLSRWNEVLQGVASYGSGYSDRPEVAALTAEAYARTGKPEDALAILNSTPDIPKTDLVRIRSEILVDQGKDPEALSLVRRSIDDGVTDPRLVLQLGTLLLRKGEAEALTYLEEAYIRLPHEPAPAMALADGLASEERFEEALSLLDEAGRLNPADPQIWVDRAYYLNRIGRYGEAIQAIEEAEALNPGDQDIINAHAYTLCLANRTEEARSVAEEALSFDPSNPAAMDTMGCVLLAEGNTGDALTYLEPAADQLPHDPEVLTHLADAYFRIGKDKEAKDLYEKALKLDSSLGKAWRGYSNLLLILKDYPEAASTIAETFRHYPRGTDLITWEEGMDGLLKQWYLSQHTNQS
jgi:Flp pilus assembly protein TadD